MQCRNAGTEGDLAGGSEHKHAILRAILLAHVQQNGGLNDLLGQVVDDVASSQKILKSGAAVFHLGKALDWSHRCRCSHRGWSTAARTRYLDGIVLSHQLFHNVHIGAVGGSWAR